MLRNKKHLLQELPQDNVQWLAQQIVSQYGTRDFEILVKAIQKLDSLMIKSWSREMPFLELVQSVQRIDSNIFSYEAKS